MGQDQRVGVLDREGREIIIISREREREGQKIVNMSTFELSILSTLNFRELNTLKMCTVDIFRNACVYLLLFCLDVFYIDLFYIRRRIIHRSESASESCLCSFDMSNLESDENMMYILLVDVTGYWAQCVIDETEQWSVCILLFSRIFIIYHLDTGPDTLPWTLPSLPPLPSPLPPLNIQHQIKLVNKLDVLYWVTFVHQGWRTYYCFRTNWFPFLCKLLCTSIVNRGSTYQMM